LLANHEVIYLEAEDIADIHDTLLDAFGGEPGIISRPNLEMATEAARRFVFGREIYPTIEMKAAAYIFEIITLHPFIDGNKRTGLMAGLSFLNDNHMDLEMEFEEALGMTMLLAQGQMSYDELLMAINFSMV
jgi:death-on-curing protein